ncbi:hypothetical protein AT705_00745 [Pseudoalteromonas rubra]|uniref:Teneurin-like YD-shell domain-containing protein n=1 Tax=Pseudoalteromonas rubra TaxID=43658 RepID=A0A0U3HF55_9GAMM|nr:hypothetical protein AT705_00745 [Pseudoalteromonas rubra]
MRFERFYNSRVTTQGNLWKRALNGKEYFTYAPEGTVLPTLDGAVDEIEKSAYGYGGVWSHSYSQHIKVKKSTWSLTVHVKTEDGGSIYVSRHDGGMDTYPERQSINYDQDGYQASRLEYFHQDETWKLTNKKNNTVEHFNSEGKLTRIDFNDGNQHSVVYDGNSTEVTDSFGNKLTLVKNDLGQLQYVTMSDGTAVQYEWNGSLLAKAYFPSDAQRQSDMSIDTNAPHRTYHYLAYEPSLEEFKVGPLSGTYWAEYTALTGITDELGHRYATWGYNSDKSKTYSTLEFARAVSYKQGERFNPTQVNVESPSSGDVLNISVTTGEDFKSRYTYDGNEQRFMNLTDVHHDRNAIGCELEGFTGPGTQNVLLGYKKTSTPGRIEGSGYAYSKREYSGGKVVTHDYKKHNIYYAANGPSYPFRQSTTDLEYVRESIPTVANGGYGTCSGDHEVCAYRLTRFQFSTVDGSLVSTSMAGQKEFNYLKNGLPQTSYLEDELSYRYDHEPYQVTVKKRQTDYTYTDTVAGLPLKKILTIDGPRTDVEDVTQYSYYETGEAYPGLLKRIVNPAGHTIEITAYENDRPTEVTNPNGSVTSYGYHYRGWLTSVTEAGDTTRYDYYDNGYLEKVTLPDGSYSKFTYNSANILTQIENNLGEKTVFSNFDAYGVPRKIEGKDASGSVRSLVSLLTDQLGRVKALTGNDGQNTEFTYHMNGSIDAINELANIVANSNGQSENVVNTTGNKYDSLGRLREIAHPDGGVIYLDYDQRDNVTMITDPNEAVTEYTYDGLDNIIQIKSPDSGTTVYWYDAAGNTTRKLDANGFTTEYTYDVLNRLTGKQFIDSPEQNITLNYDETENGKNGIGQLTSVIDSSGTLDYFYDDKGRLIKQVQQTALQTSVTEFEYNKRDQITHITYPSGRIVIYGYDAIGQIESVTTQADAYATPVELAVSIGYLPFGPMQSMELGNTLISKVTYDKDLRIEALELKKGNVDVLNQTYTYELNNDIDLISDLVDSTKTQDLAYDKMHQLSEAVGGYGVFEVDYDLAGNRTTVTKDTQVQTYSYSGSNQIQTITGHNANSFSYDAAGNLMSDVRRGHIYTFDKQNRLVAITKANSVIAEYAYNGLNQRVAKFASTRNTIYHYDNNGLLIAESDNEGVVYREYIYLNGQLLAITDLGDVSWQGYDLNSGAVVAALTASHGGMTLSGASSANSFYHHELNGDGSIGVNVEDFNAPLKERASVGLMIRGSNAQDAAYASVRLNANSKFIPIAGKIFVPLFASLPELEVSYREFAGGPVVNETVRLYGRHIKLEKYGAAVNLYNSADGLNWHRVKSVSVSMSTKSLIGVTQSNLPEDERVALSSIKVTGHAPSSEAYAIGYVHNDHIGMPSVITNDSGETIWRATHTPFGYSVVDGDVDGDANTTILNVRFPGQYYDAESGLHYNWHRYYDPALGRYISSDPLGLADGVNIYAYGRNNPVASVDPTGLFLTTLDAACLQNPALCADIVGDIAKTPGGIAKKANMCQPGGAESFNQALDYGVKGLRAYQKTMSIKAALQVPWRVGNDAFRAYKKTGSMISAMKAPWRSGRGKVNAVDSGADLVDGYNSAVDLFTGGFTTNPTTINPAKYFVSLYQRVDSRVPRRFTWYYSSQEKRP